MTSCNLMDGSAAAWGLEQGIQSSKVLKTNIEGRFTVYGFLNYSSFVLFKFRGFVIICFKFWHSCPVE